jgi:hypothetical protein
LGRTAALCVWSTGGLAGSQRMDAEASRPRDIIAGQQLCPNEGTIRAPSRQSTRKRQSRLEARNGDEHAGDIRADSHGWARAGPKVVASICERQKPQTEQTHQRLDPPGHKSGSPLPVLSRARRSQRPPRGRGVHYLSHAASCRLLGRYGDVPGASSQQLISRGDTRKETRCQTSQ